MVAAPFVAVSGGVRVFVRLAPKSSRNAVAGLIIGADGGRALKVRVTPAPENGKANAAMIKLLAREWGLAKSDLAIVAGATARRKTILVGGEPGDILARLGAWMERLDGRG